MRKCILALLVLTGVAAAQKLPLSHLLHRNHVDAERAALSEKMPRLVETRKSLGMPEVESAQVPELEALTARTEQKRSVAAVPQGHTKAKTAAARQAPVAGKPALRRTNRTEITPGTEFVHSPASDEASLGDVARQYRAEKRQAKSKTK